MGRAERAYALREQLSRAGSAVGRQLDGLRDRLPVRTPPTGRNVREELLVQALSGLAAAGLTPEEEAVAHLRLTGHSHGRLQYERTVWVADTVVVKFTEDTCPQVVTPQGEEVVGAAFDDHGERIPGRVTVRGSRRVMMSFEDIGAALGLTRWQVQSRWKSASAKFRAAQAAFDE